MTGDVQDRIFGEILSLADGDPSSLPASVESMLERELREIPKAERLRCLELLADRLSDASPTETSKGSVDSAQMSRLFSMLLGKGFSAEILSSGDMEEKFVAAMNMIFDSLNRIVRVMQTTLVGRSDELETIRQVIGSQLGQYDGGMSVREYLDQIQQAFLTSHTSFQQAARNVALELLNELDPDRISASAGSGLKFGPLRKAELFDIYQEKHRLLSEWLRSEQFTERLLREFEGVCRTSYRG